ncbi:unnamed protein product [Closterium sp. NIES-53]
MHPIRLTNKIFETRLTGIENRLLTIASTICAVVPPIFERCTPPQFPTLAASAAVAEPTAMAEVAATSAVVGGWGRRKGGRGRGGGGGAGTSGGARTSGYYSASGETDGAGTDNQLAFSSHHLPLSFLFLTLSFLFLLPSSFSHQYYYLSSFPILTLVLYHPLPSLPRICIVLSPHQLRQHMGGPLVP